MCILASHAHLKKQLAELELKLAAQGKEFWELYQPESSKQIISFELYQLLKNLFPDAVINLGDKHRFLCASNDIAVFLAQDQTNKMEYISDTEGISSYDCNVFANRLLGQFSIPGWADLTFGKVWLREPAHALNCLVDEERKFCYVDPQSDELLEYTHYNQKAVRFIEI